MRALQIRRAKNRCAKLETEMGAMVDACFDEASDDGLQRGRALTADEEAKFEKIAAQFKTASGALEVLESKKRHSKTVAERDEILGEQGAWEVDVKAYNDVLAVAGETYRAPTIPEAGTPATLELPTPYIAWDAEQQANVAKPYGAVYGEDGKVNVEATFRGAEMLSDGRAGEFDPLTGQRIEAAPLDTTSVPGAVPTMSLQLYEYAITMNLLARYVNIIQTKGLNKLEIPRRIGVPKASVIGTRANAGQGLEIGEQESSFGTAVDLMALKYGYITRFSYESLITYDVFSMQTQVVRDGGIGLANGIGEDIVIGTGAANNQMQGIFPFITATAANQVDGPTAATYSDGITPKFMMKLIGKPSQAYYLRGGKKLVTQHGTLVDILATTGTDGHGVYRNWQNFLDGVLNPQAASVIMDQNADAIAANKFPIALTELEGYTLRLAGGPRVDTSDQAYWTSDQRAVRFLQHADGAVVDTNCFFGLKAT